MKAAELGTVIVKRVYADAKHLRNWEASYSFSLRYSQGTKNATDFLMTIEAVEMAHRGDLKAFVLASTDRDFAPLARWLVERGCHVLGLGGALAPADWRESCSRFEVLDAAPATETPATASAFQREAVFAFSQASEPAAASQAAVKSAGAERREKSLLAGVGQPLSDTDTKIRAVIQSEGEGGSIAVGHLGVAMGSRMKITLAKLGSASWRAYLSARPDLYQLDPKGPLARVRWLGS